jgi:hypothetical protein
MKSSKTLATTLTLFIIASMTLIINPNIIKKASAEEGGPLGIYITPVSNSFPVNQFFSIDVNVKNAKSIHTYDFRITWDPNILECVYILKGSWLNKGGTLTTYFIQKKNNTIGWLLVAESIQGELMQSGDGVLAKVGFKAKQEGLTALHLLNGSTLIKTYVGSTKVDSFVVPNNLTAEDASYQFPTTTITTEPQNPFQASGYSFPLNITATNLCNLTTWAMNCTWDPTVLNLTQVQEEPWNTTSSTAFNYTIHEQEGRLSLNSTLQASQGESGNRTFAMLNFTVLSKGASGINITDPSLLNVRLEESLPAPAYYNATGGYLVTRHILAITPGSFYSIAKLATEPLSIIDTSLLPGFSVDLNLTITNVENLNAWDINLTWQASVLKLLEAVEGPFLSSQNATTFVNASDIVFGRVQISCNATVGFGGNGTGVLATLRFNVTTGGTFRFDITGSSLLDVNGQEIEHVVEDFTVFDNRVHDIAISSIQLSNQTIPQNGTVTISVTLLNNGTIVENFSVTIKFGAAVIAKQYVVNLLPLETRTIQLEYNVADLPGDVYQLKVKIDFLPEEKDYSNNVVYSSITVEQGNLPADYGWVVIPAIVIIVVVGFGIAFFMIRRPKKT